MGSCKITLQLSGCLSTLSSPWLWFWPRSQDNLNSSDKRNSFSSSQDSFSSFSSSYEGFSSSLVSFSSSQDRFSSSQDSFSSSLDSFSSSQDSFSSSLDSFSSSLDSFSNSQDSFSSSQDSFSSSQDSFGSSQDSFSSSHSKLWTDSAALLSKKLNNKFHPDQKFSSILRLTMDNVERIMVGSPWSCSMRSSLAPPGTSWRSHPAKTPSASPTQERFSTGSSPTSCSRAEILRDSMELAASPSTDLNSTMRTSW